MKILSLLFLIAVLSGCAFGVVNRTFADGSTLHANEACLGCVRSFDGFKSRMGQDEITVNKATESQAESLKAAVEGAVTAGIAALKASAAP